MTSTHPAVWDFTIPYRDGRTPERMKDIFKELFKKWSFQLERGDSGYEHYQGRGSLFKRRRKNELLNLTSEYEEFSDWRPSPSSNNSLKGECFYVLKKDTRISGPWTDADEEEEEVYIPRQYRELEKSLLPWQQSVWDSSEVFNSRSINLVYDPVGNNGKSTIAMLMRLHGRGIIVPPVNDHEKLTQSVCNLLMAMDERNPKCIFIDLPRAMDKSHLRGMFAAIEQIKNGYVYEMRYKFKEWFFDSPQVWVFTNIKPDYTYLSTDRWKLYVIHDLELQPWVDMDMYKKRKVETVDDPMTQLPQQVKI